MSDPIALDNDRFVLTEPLRRRNLATGLIEAATGMTVTAFIAASDRIAAAVIHADLSIPLAEQGAGSGIYGGHFPGSTLTARLAGYVGRNVFEIVKSSDGSYRSASDPIPVIDPRRRGT